MYLPYSKNIRWKTKVWQKNILSIQVHQCNNADIVLIILILCRQYAAPRIMLRTAANVPKDHRKCQKHSSLGSTRLSEKFYMSQI